METILQYTDGVKSAAVNFATNTVQVEYDDSITPEKLNEALTEIGYGLVVGSKNVQETVQEARQPGRFRVTHKPRGELRGEAFNLVPNESVAVIDLVRGASWGETGLSVRLA